MLARVLEEILATTQASADDIEKPYFLLAASSCQAVLGKGEQARFLLDQAKRIAPKDDPIFRMHAEFEEAALCSEEGHAEKAVGMFDQMSSDFSEQLEDPQFRYLYEKLQSAKGAALARLQRFNEARPLLEAAKSFDLIDADRSELLFNLGTCYLAAEEHEAALNSFLEARRIGLAKNWLGTWHYYVGTIHYRTGNYNAAKEELLESERLLNSGVSGPSTSGLYELLTFTCRALGQIADAEIYSRMARPA